MVMILFIFESTKSNIYSSTNCFSFFSSNFRYFMCKLSIKFSTHNQDSTIWHWDIFYYLLSGIITNTKRSSCS